MKVKTQSSNESDSVIKIGFEHNVFELKRHSMNARGRSEALVKYTGNLLAAKEPSPALSN